MTNRGRCSSSLCKLIFFSTEISKTNECQSFFSPHRHSFSDEQKNIKRDFLIRNCSIQIRSKSLKSIPFEAFLDATSTEVEEKEKRQMLLLTNRHSKIFRLFFLFFATNFSIWRTNSNMKRLCSNAYILSPRWIDNEEMQTTTCSASFRIAHVNKSLIRNEKCSSVSFYSLEKLNSRRVCPWQIRNWQKSKKKEKRNEAFFNLFKGF